MLKDISDTLVDQSARNIFTKEIHSNFSVIAPAGVGKTTAIVHRVLTFIDYALEIDPELVSQLVVVTYTQKAANEMLQRVQTELLVKKYPPVVFNLLNKAFFGTIHSFCLKLINTYGYMIGIPGKFEILDNAQSLSTEFTRHYPPLEELLNDPSISHIKKFMDVDDLLSLSLRLPNEIEELSSNDIVPTVSIDPLLNFTFKKKPSENTLDYLFQLKEWKNACDANLQAIGLPLDPSGPTDFKELVFNSFQPLWQWLNHVTLNAAIKISKLFQEFRLEKRLITHDDIISLTFELTRNTDALAKIRSEDLRVILDEAQDTDRNQFSILLAIVPEAKPTTCDERLVPSLISNFPKQGAFCMVGDPEQSIYSSRADLPTYMQIHNALIDSKHAQELTFTVTMRCDDAIVDCVNTLFPSILQSNKPFTQASFVPLSARPQSGEGSVLKLDPCKKDLPSDDEDPLEFEAQFLANWLSKNNSQLEINAWDEIAFLTPRKSWLLPIEKALKAVNIPCQIHSHQTINGDNPAYAWITALVAILINPFDSFEIMGVLREIFGVSDHDIAHYVIEKRSRVKNKHLHPHPLNIATKPESKGFIAECLGQLCQLYTESLKLSIYDVVCLCIERLEIQKKITNLVFHDPQHSLDVLSSLIDQAAHAEAAGMDLFAFACKLKNNFSIEKLPTTSIRNHAQLLTCHKAKGLEWKVVILPFLFKDITFPNNSFPQLYNIPLPNYPKVAICNHPAKQTYDADLKNYRLAEIERLVYVAATRASQKLIFVNDYALFPKNKTSLANLLQILPGGKNNNYWESLPSVLPPSSTTSPPSIKNPALNNRPFEKLSNLSIFQKMASAYKAATSTLKKRVPSQLSTHKEFIFSNEFSDTNNFQYGLWWHATMAKIPWQSSLENWHKVYNQSMPNCPNPLRAKKEFEQLMNSPVAKWCRSKGVIIKTEAPILNAITSMEFLEGNIDFLVFMPDSEIPWIILDWKTGALNAEQFIANYTPQLKGYADALHRIYNQKVMAYMYATRTGKLIIAE